LFDRDILREADKSGQRTISSAWLLNELNGYLGDVKDRRFDVRFDFA
jgi:hypothetical protein